MTEAPRPWWLPRLDGLAPRVAAYLSIALLPLGLIALYQTREFQEETEERSELTLLALTEAGASKVEQAIKEAIGAGEALGRVASLLDDPETCSATLGRFVGEAGPYAFVGFVPLTGPVTCSSQIDPLPLDDRDDWAGLLEEAPRPAVRARPTGTASGQPVLVVAVPVPIPEGEVGPGFVALSIPSTDAALIPVGLPELQPIRLAVINRAGEVLTSRAAVEGAPPLAELLPPQFSLARAMGSEPKVFTQQSGLGTEQVYTVAPLVPGVAYAMAVWSPRQAAQGGGGFRESPLTFPLLMWLTSLVVAFWAIHRLVIRRVTVLGGEMRHFGLNRSLSPPRSSFGAPHELREIEGAFRQMADSILQDEARMENAFRERGVLLREVHHRVKNNLQLISSIISMQVRRLPEPQVRQILRRLQDRVLTLASIYRTLYTSPDLGDVNAAPVLRAIVEQELRSAEGRVEATLDIEDVVLEPDQVVPLAFLAAEAVSNAVARASTAPGARPSLSVTLHRENERARLTIANSLAEGAPAPSDPVRGIGQHLIHAFASQIGGPVESDVGERLFRLSIAFPVLAAPAEVEPA